MWSRDAGPSMWAAACELLRRAEQLQQQFFTPRSGSAAIAWEPPVDVFETPERIHIHVALPGVAPEHVEVLIDGATLVVTGRRLLPQPAAAGALRRLEIPHGRFERRLVLPAGRFELERRELVHGLLALGLRKVGVAQGGVQR